jgi:hypothetical protein
MATLLMLICMMAGVLLGLRFKVFILVPVSLLVAAVTIVGDIVSGHAIGLVALVTYGTRVASDWLSGCLHASGIFSRTSHETFFSALIVFRAVVRAALQPNTDPG